ncbi:MAG: hypothetical protein ABR499_01620 [Gemmatimonadaceae bacterium]
MRIPLCAIAFALIAHPLAAQVAAMGADTLYLKLQGAAGPVAIPHKMIRRIDRSLGMPSRPASAVQGAVGFALLGALYGVLFRTLEAEDWKDRSVGEAAALGAGTGAGIGFVLGAIYPTERWRRIQLWESHRSEHAAGDVRRAVRGGAASVTAT